MKKIVPAYILAFAISFMLFVFEPISLYANNTEDFWFDIYAMFLPMFIVAFIVFLILAFIYTIVYFVNAKFLKKVPIYNICLFSSFVLFVFLYIQGNYLSGSLPPLDGSLIDWKQYIKQDIISIIIFLVLVIGQVVLLKKLKIEKSIKVLKFVSLSIVGMLSIALVSTLLTTDCWGTKANIPVATDKNINNASTDTNFFIFLTDAVDSMTFKQVLDDTEKYRDTFNDFTYFPDTLSGYPYTRNSIPFILSGQWYENEIDFEDYYNQAMNDSELMNELEERGYDINLYEYNALWSDEKSKNVENFEVVKKEIRLFKFVKQEIKYILFRYLPYYFKKYSHIENMNFSYCMKVDIDNIYDHDNVVNYKLIKNEKLNLIENKNFHFWHIEGSHQPHNLDENVNRIPATEGTYEQKIEATINIIDAYLNRLKENDVYDNSIIIILADHGYNYGNIIGRQNPILLVKGLEEKHSSMKVSDKQISQEDLSEAYIELLDGKSSREIFKNIPKDRDRRFLYYVYTHEDNVVEYIQLGKAWEDNKLKATGKQFNR